MKYLTPFWLLLLLPSLVLAAFNDVVFQTGATVSIAGFSYNVSGSVASTTVGASSMDVAFLSSSSIKLSTSLKHNFTVAGATNLTVNFTCAVDESTLEINNNGVSGTTTVTITPVVGTCTGPGSTVFGGGAHIPTPPPPPPPPATTTPAIPALPAEPGLPGVPAVPATPAIPAGPALAVSPVFNFNFGPGASGEHVRRLQRLLNSDPDTRVAEFGAGSPGNETHTYGPRTANAVGRFQYKYGLPSVKRVGPATRAKIAEVFGGQAPAAPPTWVPVQNVSDLEAQLQSAQAQLNALLEQLRQVLLEELRQVQRQ